MTRMTTTTGITDEADAGRKPRRVTPAPTPEQLEAAASKKMLADAVKALSAAQKNAEHYAKRVHQLSTENRQLQNRVNALLNTVRLLADAIKELDRSTPRVTREGGGEINYVESRS